MDRSTIIPQRMNRWDLKVTAPVHPDALLDLHYRTVIEDPGNPYRMGSTLAVHPDWIEIYKVLCTIPEVFNSTLRFTGGPRSAPYFWVLIVAPDDHEPLFYGRMQWRRDLERLQLYW